MTNIMESLQAEFPVEQLGWKIINTFESQGHFFAFVAPFVDARAIQDRFDEVFGIDNWQVSYEKWGEKATKCTISVFLNERWISKEDGSGMSTLDWTIFIRSVSYIPLALNSLVFREFECC
ncbi:hypothetical protein QCI43_28780 [Bacillus cereus group sp. MG21]